MYSSAWASAKRRATKKACKASKPRGKNVTSMILVSEHLQETRGASGVAPARSSWFQNRELKYCSLSMCKLAQNLTLSKPQLATLSMSKPLRVCPVKTPWLNPVMLLVQAQEQRSQLMAALTVHHPPWWQCCDRFDSFDGSPSGFIHIWSPNVM